MPLEFVVPVPVATTWFEAFFTVKPTLTLEIPVEPLVVKPAVNVIGPEVPYGTEVGLIARLRSGVAVTVVELLDPQPPFFPAFVDE